MRDRILVVEDEPSIADNITYALSTEGFTPEWRRTGADALAALAEGPFALVILDVGLPDANGFDLAREIRKAHEVPLIFVTARSHEIDRVVGLEIGADDYVVKPFSPRELVARVKAVLRRTRGKPSGAVGVPAETSPGFALDEERHRITYHGQKLELSRLEFNLLAVLVRRPGQVFSRDQLMELAWQEPSASMDRTVDTHMKTIRQKLRAVRPDEEPIVTHRGVGYSLRERA
jgi:two-component system catabolic regulation response regulator CreB